MTDIIRFLCIYNNTDIKIMFQHSFRDVLGKNVKTAESGMGSEPLKLKASLNKARELLRSSCRSFKSSISVTHFHVATANTPSLC